MHDEILGKDFPPDAPAPGSKRDWYIQVFNRFSRVMDDAQFLSTASRRAVSGLIHGPEVVRAEINLEDVLNEQPDGSKAPKTEEQVRDEAKRLDHAMGVAAMAQRQIDADFALIEQNFVVLLWSALESVVKNIVAGAIENDLDLMQDENFVRLKVSLGQFQRLTPKERPYFVTELIERETAAELRLGVERFEAILK